MANAMDQGESELQRDQCEAQQLRRSGLYFPLLSETDPFKKRKKPVIVYGAFEALYSDHEQIFAY